MNIDRLNLTLADIEAQLLRKLAESANLSEMDGEDEMDDEEDYECDCEDPENCDCED
jgi:hypothetical protein